MDAELKAQWLAALRSGEYEQTQGQLRYTDPEGNKSYCCLGVLCDLYDAGRWDVNTYKYAGYKSTVAVPHTLVPLTFGKGDEQADEEGELPFTDRDNHAIWLSTLNDSGMSFDQIADVIEYAF